MRANPTSVSIPSFLFAFAHWDNGHPACAFKTNANSIKRKGQCDKMLSMQKQGANKKWDNKSDCQSVAIHVNKLFVGAINYFRFTEFHQMDIPIDVKRGNKFSTP